MPSMECVSHDAAEKTLHGFGRSLKERGFALSIIRTCSYIWFRMVGPTECSQIHFCFGDGNASFAANHEHYSQTSNFKQTCKSNTHSQTLRLGFAEHAAGSKEEGQI